MLLLFPFSHSGGNFGPTYSEINWQQYYAATFIAYHGHAAPAVPQHLAQLRETSGAFYFNFK